MRPQRARARAPSPPLTLLASDARPADAAPADAFVAAAVRLLRAADAAQVRLAPEKCAFRSAAARGARSHLPVAKLSRRLRDACLAANAPGRGLLALRCAALKAAPTPAHLTPQHVDLFVLALASQNHGAALPLLDGPDVLEVNPVLTGVAPKDVLLHCFYGATLLAGLRRYGRACELLVQALVAPTPALNAIQLACYKKLVRII